MNLICSIYEYLENYQKDLKDLNLLFELKKEENNNRNYNISNLDVIIEKYTEMMDKFIICYNAIKSEM